MKLNPASYPNTELTLEDRALGEKGKNRQVATVGYGPQDCVCPDLEGVVRGFIVMVPGEHEQLMYILLIGWR